MIEEICAIFQRGMNEPGKLLLVQTAQAHTAHNNSGNRRPAAAQRNVFLGETPLQI